MLEPPIGDEDDEAADAAFTDDLVALLAEGRRGDALEHFLTGSGVPAGIIADMRGTESWSAMEAVAPTLVYDCRISEATSPAVLAAVTAPVLVLDSQGSSDDLTGWAATVGAQLPNGSHRSLPGQWHGVPDEDLAPVLAAFFTSET